MMSYSIEAALKSACFDRVIVSTDDQEIAAVAKEYGAEVPFVRPDELAGDHAETLPVIKQAIEWLEEHGGQPSDVCCLYATAPFVQADAIEQAYKQLQTTLADYCFSVTSYAFPIQRAIKITQQQRIEMFCPEQLNTRSQDLEKAYHDAGQFYWGKAEAFKQLKPLFSENASPFLLPRYLVQDVDTQQDWIRAEMMCQVLQQSALFE